LINSALDVVHGGAIFGRRVKVLTDHLARLVPENAKLLDVGAGDGNIGVKLREKRPDITIEGVDVFVREQTAYPVTAFDGEHIPFANDSFDCAMFIDVLHHTKDPITLLAEAGRVAKTVVVKDHLREGLLAEETLKAMDWVGNARHGVVLPYNYFNRMQWDAALERAGLVVDEWRTDVGLYAPGLSLLFDRSLHFVARFSRRR
jgi:SAM-dependent methyltransferase